MLQLDLLADVHHMVGISGKDSLAAAIVQSTLNPDLPYQYFFNDVGSELPETYEWLDRVEKKMGWSIQRIGKSLEETIAKYGGFLPSPLARYCTKETKIQPIEAFQSGKPTYLYLGIRADEDRGGFIPPNNNICPVYPLVNAKITLPVVWALLESRDLLPPAFFWQRLYDAVCDRFPKDRWISLQPWQERMLFAGRSRNNCYFCFFQRLYEWVWLLETHPDLFERAAAFEKADYTWKKGESLNDIANRKDDIFDRHVSKIVSVVSGKGKTDVDGAIALTSCGVLCGK